MTGTPIIVVPAGFSDLFTMLNVKDFLEDGVYVPNMQKKSEGCRKAQSIILQHMEDGEQYTFKIVDSVARFRDKDWCVLAHCRMYRYRLNNKLMFILHVFCERQALRCRGDCVGAIMAV